MTINPVFRAAVNLTLQTPEGSSFPLYSGGMQRSIEFVDDSALHRMTQRSSGSAAAAPNANLGYHQMQVCFSFSRQVRVTWVEITFFVLL